MLRRNFFLFLVLIAGIALPAFAQSGSAQKLLGTFGNWRAYEFREKDEPVCYMALTVPAPDGKIFKRGMANLMITHRPGENSKDVISYAPGYNFKPASDVRMQIGKASFSLFTTKDTAWTRDAAADRALAAAIRNGQSMRVTGIPAAKVKGPVIDTLNLAGAAKAYQAIGKACGLEPETPKAPALKKKKAAR